MGYFKELPNLQYLSRLPNSNSNENYITVKNIFKRAAIRSDVINVITAFVYYQITDNERPEQVANKVYENPELDWIVLHTNNITNVREQWPLSNQDLYNYMLDKYGSDETIANIHHYETIQILDDFKRLIVPAGLKVDSNFQVTYAKTDYSLVTTNPTQPITNYEYEEKVDNDKRNIFILKSRYLNIVFDDMEEIMQYKKGSTQYVSESLKTGDNIKLYS